MELIPEKTLGFIVRRAGRALRNRVQLNIREQGLDMTMEQGGVLMRLWMKEGGSQADLAAFLGKDKTTIARLVDGMEKTSLIVRVASEKDKRIKLLYLTQKGKEIGEQFKLAIMKTMKAATAGIDQEEVTQCIDILTRVYENLGDSGDLLDSCK